jgi:hypothetical protein
MYASNYSKNLITAEEKVAELMKQRDAALIRAEKAERELADHITALKISNRSADEQMRYKRDAESKVEQLNLELTALGDLAVGHWDDPTVGRVDALIPHETQVTYKEQLKTLFSASSELARIRSLFPAICKALGNGAFCTSDVSVGFLESIPNEVSCVVTRLRTENERLKALGSWTHTCIHHTDAERKAGVACPVCVTVELTRLRDEIANQKVQNNHNWQFQEISEEALKRAEKAEAELRIAQNWVDHHSKHADDLIGENVRLRAEVERLKGMRTAAEAIMTDVAEANEEIAIARAEKAEAALAQVVNGTIDGGSIDEKFTMIHVPVSPFGYRVGQPVKVILPTLDSNF